MGSLDIKIHDNIRSSIKDLAHDLDIKEKKWDYLFNFLSKHSTEVYFYGNRLYYSDNELDETINYLAEEILEDEFEEILFRFYPASLMSNRNLISKLWECFEYPSMIFLEDPTKQDILIEQFGKNNQFKNIVNQVPGVYIIYRLFEQDVLWIENSTDAIPVPSC